MDQPLDMRGLWAGIALSCAAAAPAAAQERELFDGGKLLLTNGVASIEGTSGGGLATWATIAGRETDAGIGISAHGTIVELPDYGWMSNGVQKGPPIGVEEGPPFRII